MGGSRLGNGQHSVRRLLDPIGSRRLPPDRAADHINRPNYGPSDHATFARRAGRLAARPYLFKRNRQDRPDSVSVTGSRPLHPGDSTTLRPRPASNSRSNAGMARSGRRLADPDGGRVRRGGGVRRPARPGRPPAPDRKRRTRRTPGGSRCVTTPGLSALETATDPGPAAADRRAELELRPPIGCMCQELALPSRGSERNHWRTHSLSVARDYGPSPWRRPCPPISTGRSRSS